VNHKKDNQNKKLDLKEKIYIKNPTLQRDGNL
jgi:hypothetical protein